LNARLEIGIFDLPGFLVPKLPREISPVC
jgi:hypothetical protein